VRPVRILDQELAAVVLLWPAQKERGGDVGADLGSGAGHEPHSVVDVIAEFHAAVVAVEHRRIDALGERCADEQRIALERGEDRIAQLGRHAGALVHLKIAFQRSALVAGGHATVYPRVGGRLELRPNRAHLLCAQHLRDLHDHRYARSDT
jgi:hypothetical protein